MALELQSAEQQRPEFNSMRVHNLQRLSETLKF